MSKNTSLLLIIWNVLLTALVAFGLLRGKSGPEGATSPGTSGDDPGVVIIPSDSSMDRGALKEARIAFFTLDSLQEHLELIKDQRALFQGEASRHQNKLMKRQAEAQDEANALMAKDPTYSTKAEQEKDMMRLQQLDAELKELQASSADAMDQLEMRIMGDMTTALKEFLEEYNKTAGFDYVIMMQPGGQVWPGNPGLDISNDVIAGMNARYAEKKAAPKKP
ncbi:MAG: OmpH family outer membrane protein [Flavobacteriales bacterium]